MKEVVARELAQRVKHGEVIGVGTGSTVDLALSALGERVKTEGLKVAVIPTSYQSAWKCEKIGLEVIYPGFCGALAWGFDGADEVDPRNRLIKGRGGAMLQEKILAARCKEFIIIVDETKLVNNLGDRFPIPLEVVPSAISLVERALTKLGATEMFIREGNGKHGPVITEAGNIIVDVRFKVIGDDMESELKKLLGVVETGLFFGYASEIWVARKGEVEKRNTKR